MIGNYYLLSELNMLERPCKLYSTITMERSVKVKYASLTGTKPFLTDPATPVPVSVRRIMSQPLYSGVTNVYSSETAMFSSLSVDFTWK